MSNSSLTSLSLGEAVRLIKVKKLSPVELTNAYLSRIEALNPNLNCFITVTAELALEQARQAEVDLMRAETGSGPSLGLIYGAPLALKDLFETAGVRTTAGAIFHNENIPERDSAAYQKLRSAGAILLGKTNLHEIALGLTSVNPHYGAVRNPWYTERIAGGSSGGSGAALAARLCAGSLGTDTGGSIRVPSALCGIAGLKPTKGRVSLRGVIPLSWNLDHVGPMARNIEDLALLLQVIAGYDREDPASIDVSVPNYLDGLRGGVKDWRIGLVDDSFFQKTEEAVRLLVNQAAAVFDTLGASVDLTGFPGAYQAALANGMMTTADAAVYYSDRLKGQPDDLGEDVRQRLNMGADLSISDYIRARRSQVLLRRQFEEFFDHFDILLTPTTPVAAPPISGPDAIEMAGVLTRYTAPFNLTGLPAISIPCGFTSEGLPAGLQMIAPPWQEARLLQAAFAYESATEWHRLEPEV